MTFEIKNSNYYPVPEKDINFIKSIIEKYRIILPKWVNVVELRYYTEEKSEGLATLKDEYGLFYVIIGAPWYERSIEVKEYIILHEKCRRL